MALQLTKEFSRPWEQARQTVRTNFELLQTFINSFVAQQTQPPVTTVLTDATVIAVDASDLAPLYRVVALGDRTLGKPINPVAGQRLLVQHVAGGGSNRTLSLSTGVGGFRFGSTITGLTATVAGKTDYIDCVYNDTDHYWDVLLYTKGVV